MITLPLFGKIFRLKLSWSGKSTRIYSGVQKNCRLTIMNLINMCPFNPSPSPNCCGIRFFPVKGSLLQIDQTANKSTRPGSKTFLFSSRKRSCWGTSTGWVPFEWERDKGEEMNRFSRRKRIKLDEKEAFFLLVGSRLIFSLQSGMWWINWQIFFRSRPTK